MYRPPNFIRAFRDRVILITSLMNDMTEYIFNKWLIGLLVYWQTNVAFARSAL